MGRVHQCPFVTLTFIPPGYHQPSVTTVGLARLWTAWGKRWWAFDTPYGYARKLWWIPGENRYCCRAEVGIVDKVAYCTKSKRPEIRAAWLGEKLARAYRRFPGLTNWIDMAKELEALNKRLHRK